MNVKVLEQVDQFVSRIVDGDKLKNPDIFGPVSVTFERKDQWDGHTYRVTVERVEVLPDIKPGQTWIEKQTGNRFIVISIDKFAEQVGLVRPEPGNALPLLWNSFFHFRECFFLAQDVCEVSE